MKIVRILFFLSVYVGSSVASEFGERMMMSDKECQGEVYCPPSTTPTSIVALIGCPNCWNNKAINVSGWIAYDIHGSTLFMSTEHCENGLNEYGIGVRLTLIQDSEAFLTSNKACQLSEVQGIYKPTVNREPKPGVIKYRNLWPGIVDAEYLKVGEQ